MDPTEVVQGKENLKVSSNGNTDSKDIPEITCTVSSESNSHEDDEVKDNTGVSNIISSEQNFDKPHDCIDEETEEDMNEVFTKSELVKKRFSVDFKKSRIDFKRFSVDFGRNAATLQELANLERELARTNVDVRIGRRKSSGILKSSSDSGDISEKRPKPRQESCSDDDDVFEKAAEPSDADGAREPPATPVGRDELALRRHRFFSELVCAARAAVEHRVRFDPLGPVVAESGI
ncbi:unnamed protein product [Euphydryas editha]|uniref:Uncharacterized protein n=1 Tax=Euphydryas editha TaxID=104508 RepID=A0AAU9UTR1_EUPED|nr:unnamed protein product [Euphydryas editha]